MAESKARELIETIKVMTADERAELAELIWHLPPPKLIALVGEAPVQRSSSYGPYGEAT